MRHVLVTRLDSMGDMLAAGPAIRAVASGADRVTVLAGPLGAGAARLLPGVDQVLEWACPWILSSAPPVDADSIAKIVEVLRHSAIDEAVVLTSFHQSALPTALLLRMAGISRICAVSTDYPGSLLDVRLPEPGEAPESVRMLEVAAGAGFRLPLGDEGRLAVQHPLPSVKLPVDRPYVVAHPGTSAPARAYPEPRWRETVALLRDAGWPVVLTGSAGERGLTARIAAGVSAEKPPCASIDGTDTADSTDTTGDFAARRPGPVLDLAGRLDLAELAAVLEGAAVAVIANTGPAHLAAAVGTPVVSLFAPVVPAVRWAPFGVPVALLGDQDAACRNTRAQVCPTPGHPCLDSVGADQVLAAVRRLSPGSSQAAARSESEARQ